MRIFVTGGAGFIGSRVVRTLCEQGHDVRCLIRPTTDTRRIDALPVERHFGDLRDPAAVEDGMRGMEGCIHLASVSSWDQIRSDALESTVIDGTRHVLRAARDGGVRTVYISSCTAVNGSVQPKPFDESARFELHGSGLRYAIAKHEAENLVMAEFSKGLPVVIVNPVETYGPDDFGMITAGNIRDILRDWPAFAFSGGTAVAHVDDIAQGIVAALERGRPGERYILGGENLTIEALVRLVLDIDGQNKPVVRVPAAWLKWTVRLLDQFGLPRPLAPDVLDYATLHWFVNYEKASRELGYSPRPARDTLTPVVRWLREADLVNP
jgi:dihydroflavonol-4-reductase